MTNHLMHPATIAQVMVNFANRFGIDTPTCLLGSGIAPEELSRPNTWLSRSQEIQLLENLLTNLPDKPALGFELGLQYNLATFGIWGFAIRTCPTLADAIKQALRYLPLSTAYCRFSTFQTRETLTITADPSAIEPHLQQFLLERDLGTSLNLLGEMGLHGIPVKRLEFKNLPESHRTRIAELTGIQAGSGYSANAIVLDRRMTELTLPTYDAHLLRVFEDQCARQLRMRQVDGVVGQVRQLLLGSLGMVCSLEDVALALALSPRSLRRRLNDEGHSFRDVLETERKQLAAHLLSSHSMTQDEMALHLGYSDTASFTRAFRRWYACSPGDYRRNRMNSLTVT